MANTAPAPKQPVLNLSSKAWSQHTQRPFSLQEFVHSMGTPLVCIEFGAQWCESCKKMKPIFHELARQAAGLMACFHVDVEESEDIAVAAGITNLPTFVFFTTKLSVNQQDLEVIEKVVGENHKDLQINFSKAVQIAIAYAQQLQASAQAQPSHTAQPPSAQQQPPSAQHPHSVQMGQPSMHGQAVQSASASLADGNHSLKGELLEIRATLIAALQKTEKILQAL